LLIPNFLITAKDALQQVIPNTADSSSKSVDAQVAQLQVTTGQGATEVGIAGSTLTVPSASSLSYTIAGSTDPHRLTYSVDPILQHLAADSLFQEVTLINREVKSAARRYDYRPYLVRFKLAMVPFTHNEPYDGYCDISFFAMNDALDPGQYFKSLTADLKAD